MKQKIRKYHDALGYFICPICKTPFSASENTLRCTEGHSFDIASKGYVNFMRKPRNLDGYGPETFRLRDQIMNRGFYDHISDFIVSEVKRESPGTVLDIGTGTGYFTRRLEEKTDALCMGLDFSKAAINIAARGNTDSLFMVSDIADMPIMDHGIDMILNIYTPANYPQFRRVLKKDGIIIKAVPGRDHMQELRKLIGEDLKRSTYSNTEVKNIFKENAEVTRECSLSETFETNPEINSEIIGMTPMMFGREDSRDLIEKMTSVTIAADIMIGRIKEKNT